VVLDGGGHHAGHETVCLLLVLLLLLLLLETRAGAELERGRGRGRAARPQAARRLGLRGQPPPPSLQTVGAHPLAHHAHLEALLVATVLAPVAPSLVHDAVHGARAHVLGVLLHRALEETLAPLAGAHPIVLARCVVAAHCAHVARQALLLLLVRVVRLPAGHAHHQHDGAGALRERGGGGAGPAPELVGGHGRLLADCGLAARGQELAGGAHRAGGRHLVGQLKAGTLLLLKLQVGGPGPELRLLLLQVGGLLLLVLLVEVLLLLLLLLVLVQLQLLLLEVLLVVLQLLVQREGRRVGLQLGLVLEPLVQVVLVQWLVLVRRLVLLVGLVDLLLLLLLVVVVVVVVELLVLAVFLNDLLRLWTQLDELRVDGRQLSLLLLLLVLVVACRLVSRGWRPAAWGVCAGVCVCVCVCGGRLQMELLVQRGLRLVLVVCVRVRVCVLVRDVDVGVELVRGGVHLLDVRVVLRDEGAHQLLLVGGHHCGPLSARHRNGRARSPRTAPAPRPLGQTPVAGRLLVLVLVGRLLGALSLLSRRLLLLVLLVLLNLLLMMILVMI